jgi:hypothetical protein
MFLILLRYMEAGGSSVMSTDIEKWISGETDVFFNSGKLQKGPCFWKRPVALVVTAGCTYRVWFRHFEAIFRSGTHLSASRCSVADGDYTGPPGAFSGGRQNSVASPTCQRH